MIHSNACLAEDVVLGQDLEIGPFAVVESGVVLGDGCVLGAHAVIHSGTTLGPNNRIYPHAVLGGDPQDLSAEAGGLLVVGAGNVFREGVTVHRSKTEGGVTRIGSNCFIMANAHIAHDCQVGDAVIITNNVMLAGHVEIGDHVVLGGAASVHQHARVGSYAMLGGMSGARRDVLPFTLASGLPALHYRLNTVGLRRNGITGERYRVLEQAFRALRSGKGWDEVPQTADVKMLAEWMAASKRGVAGFVRAHSRSEE